MATERDIIFRVQADTNSAKTNVEKLDKSLNTANKNVQETFNDLRARIKETEQAINEASRAYGKNSQQADELRKELSNLNVEYAKLSQNNTDLSATFEDVYGETMDVNKAIGELEDRMYMLYVTGQQNTQEFRDLQQQVAEYRQAVISVDRAVDQLAEQGQALGTALQIGETVVAGYGAVQGAMALVGVENEKLLEVMTKLQAVQTVLVSLEQLKLNLDKQSLVMTKGRAVATKVLTFAQTGYSMATGGATVATTALGTAMLLLPIFAIIAGITALIVIMVKLMGANEDASESADKYTNALERQNRLIDLNNQKVLRDYDNKIKLAKAYNKSADEIFSLEMARMEEEEKQRIASRDRAKKEYEDALTMYSYYRNKEEFEASEKYKAIAEEQKKMYYELKREDGQYQVDSEVARVEFERKQRESQEKDNQKRLENHRKHLDKLREEEEKANQLRLERQRMLEDLMVKNIEDSNVRQLAQLELNNERERQQLIEKFGKDTELLKELEIKQDNEMTALIKEIEQKASEEAEKQRKEDADRRAEAYQRELDDEKARLEARIIRSWDDFYARMEAEEEMALLERDIALENEELTLAERELIHAQFDEKLRKLTEERVEFEKSKAKELNDAIESFTTQGMNAITSLTEAYFSFKSNKIAKGSREEEEFAKKQFKIQKALMLTQAGIDAYKAVTASLALAPIAIGPIPNPAGIASLAFASLTSAANIAKIASMKYDGGNATTPSVSAPSIPSVEALGQDTSDLPTANSTDNLPTYGQSQVVILQSELELANQQSSNTATISTWG